MLTVDGKRIDTLIELRFTRFYLLKLILMNYLVYYLYTASVPRFHMGIRHTNELTMRLNLPLTVMNILTYTSSTKNMF